jgi:hypothetical protein
MSKPEIVVPLTWEQMSPEMRALYHPSRRRRFDDLPEVDFEYSPIAEFDREVPSYHRNKR